MILLQNPRVLELQVCITTLSLYDWRLHWILNSPLIIHQFLFKSSLWLSIFPNYQTGAPVNIAEKVTFFSMWIQRPPSHQKYFLTLFLIHLYIYSVHRAHMHGIACMWKSKDSLEWQSSSSFYFLESSFTGLNSVGQDLSHKLPGVHLSPSFLAIGTVSSVCHHVPFCVDPWSPNSGPHIHRSSTLPTESSLQPLLTFLNICKHMRIVCLSRTC